MVKRFGLVVWTSAPPSTDFSGVVGDGSSPEANPQGIHFFTNNIPNKILGLSGNGKHGSLVRVLPAACPHRSSFSQSQKG
eukprot:s1043_g23.t2